MREVATSEGGDVTPQSVDRNDGDRSSDRGPLPLKVIIALTCGFAGMSVLVNILNVLLVFFYLPPDTADLPVFISDTTIFGFFSLVAMVAGVGRITDSVTDPLIATWSDRSTNRRGRRIPFMAVGMVPSAILVVMMFVPPVPNESGWNVAWLLVVQFFLYGFLTAYVTPAFALVADLGESPDERLRLATWTSFGYSVGVVLGAMGTVVVELFDNYFEPYIAWQVSVAVVACFAVALMAVPVKMIDEPKWSRGTPASLSLMTSVRTVLRNPFFRFYAAADFAYFGGLAIIQTGILYYVTVLLRLEEWFSTVLLLVMVVFSAVLFPVVAKWARKRGGGRGITVFAFLLGAAVFLTISGMGLIDGYPFLQAALPIAIFSLPFAIISVMPQWILADITEHAALTEGEDLAGMFYATRSFLQKLAMTAGIVLFAVLLQSGRDVGDDLGVRLTAVAGAILYAMAALLFRGYDEPRLQRELAEAGQARFAADSQPVK